MPSPTALAKPYALDLSLRGHIEGVTLHDPHTEAPTCHYFGGIPYGLPPIGPFRWRKPRPLPPCYRYGTKANPGRFAGGAGVCPQPGYRGKRNDSSWDEDCAQVNVWVPIGPQPPKGWPVFFYIHGGWLQFGTPNSFNFGPLLGQTSLQCIFVCPAYRLNLFGFMASHELEEEASTTPGGAFGNYGFWDQRLALEWTYKNISYFGGDPSNITVAGYSAGAHSVFQQLAHDLFEPRPTHQYIARAIMFSNGPGMQPRSTDEVQAQFDSLLDALRIPLDLPSSEKLARLRALPAHSLISAAETLPIHEFRAVTDGSFVSPHLISRIQSGAFAARMRARNLPLLLGECRDEHSVYQTWRPLSTHHPPGSAASLQRRLEADYPRAAVKALMPLYCPGGKLPTFNGKKCTDWDDAFGKVYADLQVHALQRGFVDALVRGGVEDLVGRYRIEWRAECVAKSLPVEWGVTHGSDVAIWFWGFGMDKIGLRDHEKDIVRRWTPAFEAFVRDGDLSGWREGQRAKAKVVRRLRSDGAVDFWKDEVWERGLRVWKTACDALERPAMAKL